MSVNDPDLASKPGKREEVPREGTGTDKVMTKASNKEPRQDQTADGERMLQKAKEIEEKEKKKKSDKCHNTGKETSNTLGEHSRHADHASKKKWYHFPFHSKKRINKEHDAVSVYHSAESVTSSVYDDAISRSSSKESVEETVVINHTIFSYLGITKPTVSIIKKENNKSMKNQPEDSTPGISKEQRADNLELQKTSGEP